MYSRRKKSTFILLCRTWLVEYYLEKWFVIIEQISKKLISVPNKAEQITHVINKHKS